MKIKIIITVLCLLSSLGGVYSQTGGFTINTTNGVTVVQGSYWVFIYDNQKVISPPVQVINGETKSIKQLFAADSEQECYNRITILFGQEEADRVRNLYNPVTPPDDTTGVPLNNNQ